jgi:hypothetical protein
LRSDSNVESPPHLRSFPVVRSFANVGWGKYINAVAPKGGSQNINVLTVVVEVKGCWNPETLHAMETQLADRYMKHNSFSCGLYIVGWYMCEKWTDTDYRKKVVCKKTQAELEEFLARQANKVEREAASMIVIKSFILDLTL